MELWLCPSKHNIMENTLRIGPPRGGPDRRDLASAKGILNEFRWFWMDLIQHLTRFWCVLPMCLGFLVCKFYDFWAILHAWREQSNTGSDKNECVSIHFRRSVDGTCFWPLQHRASYFLWSFCSEFSTILSNFCIHGVSKATPGTTKMNAICCIFAGQATACVFDHCNTGVMFFRAHFAVILDAF